MEDMKPVYEQQSTAHSMNKLKKILTHPFLLTLIRVGVGGIFLVFGFVKAIEPLEIFYTSVASYKMVPEILIEPFGLFVLAAEIIFGLFLTVGLFTKWSNRAILTLLVMFIIAIGQAMVRGLDLPDCGCSGSSISLGESPVEVITRDIVMLIGLAWLEITKKYGWTLDQFLSRKKI